MERKASCQIEEFGRQIGRELGAEKVALFGSYANGVPSVDSDVDLLVGTSEKVCQRLAMGDTFIQEILTQGRVLYKAADG